MATTEPQETKAFLEKLERMSQEIDEYLARQGVERTVSLGRLLLRIGVPKDNTGLKEWISRRLRSNDTSARPSRRVGGRLTRRAAGGTRMHNLKVLTKALSIFESLQSVQLPKEIRDEIELLIPALTEKRDRFIKKSQRDQGHRIDREKKDEEERDALRRERPPGFSAGIVDYGVSRESSLYKWTQKRPTCLFVILPFRYQLQTGYYERDLNSEPHFLVFAKDIGVPAYERVSTDAGFAVRLTKAGEKARRALKIGSMVAKG
jgi:hypothetical protein